MRRLVLSANRTGLDESTGVQITADTPILELDEETSDLDVGTVASLSFSDSLLSHDRLTTKQGEGRRDLGPSTGPSGTVKMRHPV